jgi:hypothetical protein
MTRFSVYKVWGNEQCITAVNTLILIIVRVPDIMGFLRSLQASSNLLLAFISVVFVLGPVGTNHPVFVRSKTTYVF